MRQLPDKERLVVDQQAQWAACDAQRRENPRDKQLGKALRDLQNQVAETREKCADLRSKITAIEGDSVLAQLAREHSDIDSAVLEETARLHAGDPENLALWRKFLPQCKDDIQTIYQRMGIRFDHELGESFYHDRLERIVADLKQRGLAHESNGAECVFLSMSSTRR